MDPKLISLPLSFFSTAIGADAAGFEPELDRPWNSSYGVIHWDAGWYGIEENTIRITGSEWDAERRVYVIEGIWGRVRSPDYKGTFRFEFSSSDEFSGWWNQAGNENRTAWEGTVIPPGLKVAAPAKFVPDLGVSWNSDHGVINWKEGWYGNEEKTLTISEQGWDRERGGYVVKGFWGRRSSPATKGPFEFIFSDPATFTGGWSNTSDGRGLPYPWSGKIPK